VTAAGIDLAVHLGRLLRAALDRIARHERRIATLEFLLVEHGIPVPPGEDR
jgi:hypothetical protein